MDKETSEMKSDPAKAKAVFSTLGKGAKNGFKQDTTHKEQDLKQL